MDAHDIGESSSSTSSFMTLSSGVSSVVRAFVYKADFAVYYYSALLVYSSLVVCVAFGIHFLRHKHKQRLHMKDVQLQERSRELKSANQAVRDEKKKHKNKKKKLKKKLAASRQQLASSAAELLQLKQELKTVTNNMVASDIGRKKSDAKHERLKEEFEADHERLKEEFEADTKKHNEFCHAAQLQRSNYMKRAKEHLDKEQKELKTRLERKHKVTQDGIMLSQKNKDAEHERELSSLREELASTKGENLSLNGKLVATQEELEAAKVENSTLKENKEKSDDEYDGKLVGLQHDLDAAMSKISSLNENLEVAQYTIDLADKTKQESDAENAEELAGLQQDLETSKRENDWWAASKLQWDKDRAEEVFQLRQAAVAARAAGTRAGQQDDNAEHLPLLERIKRLPSLDDTEKAKAGIQNGPNHLFVKCRGCQADVRTFVYSDDRPRKKLWKSIPFEWLLDANPGPVNCIHGQCDCDDDQTKGKKDCRRKDNVFMRFWSGLK
jgi:hypothetical protein